MDNNTFFIERITSPSQDIVDVLNQLMQQLNSQIQPLTIDTLEKIIQSDDTYLFVAKDSTIQKIVGTLTLIVYQTPSGKRGYIEDVVVDENSRGKGLGKKLMEEGIKKARELDLEYVGLTSRPEREAANALYQRLGFQKRDTNVYRLMIQ